MSFPPDSVLSDARGEAATQFGGDWDNEVVSLPGSGLSLEAA